MGAPHEVMHSWHEAKQVAKNPLTYTCGLTHLPIPLSAFQEEAWWGYRPPMYYIHSYLHVAAYVYYNYYTIIIIVANSSAAMLTYVHIYVLYKN